MKKFIIPLVAVGIVAALLLGCMPGAPVTPPVEPVTPPVEPVVPPPPAAAKTAADIPELQELIAKGLMDPTLKMNPFGEDFFVKPDGTPYKVANTGIFLACENMVYLDGLQRSLIERAGGEYSFYDPNFDPLKQIGFVDDVRTVLRPDALGIMPVDVDMLVPSVAHCVDSGIPAYNWEIPINTEKVSCRVSFDRYKAGAEVGELYMQIADERGTPINVYEVWGDRSLPTDWRYHIGFRESGILEHPLCTVLESADTLWTSEATATYIMDAWTTHPELNALFLSGGAQGTGAVEGLRAIGRLLPPDDPDHVLVSFADQDTPSFNMMREGKIDYLGTHTSYLIADLTVKLMFTELVLGQPIPLDVWLPCPIITTATAETMTQYGAAAGIPLLPVEQWDVWPVLDTSELGFEAPTKAMRMELQGY